MGQCFLLRWKGHTFNGIAFSHSSVTSWGDPYNCNNTTGQVNNIQSLPPVTEEQEWYIFLYTITVHITATALQICSTFLLSQDFVMILIPSKLYPVRLVKQKYSICVKWSILLKPATKPTTKHNNPTCVMWLILLNPIRNPWAMYCIPARRQHACTHNFSLCLAWQWLPVR